jgi:hypothetical protein
MIEWIFVIILVASANDVIVMTGKEAFATQEACISYGDQERAKMPRINATVRMACVPVEYEAY